MSTIAPAVVTITTTAAIEIYLLTLRLAADCRRLGDQAEAGRQLARAEEWRAMVKLYGGLDVATLTDETIGEGT